MAKKKRKIDSRIYMELAIEAMKKSVQEPRPDKRNPKVGAVLVMSDGTVDRAYRGEFRYGDHAEYTLLDKKHHKENLTGSYLFTTLEPCAPGARREPKMSCSERIVNARIKEVWIGLEDPDPAVDRKGIAYLQDKGIKVNMFDRDLQQLIEKENSVFLQEAKTRAEKIFKKKHSNLNEIEQINKKADLSDFSDEALEFYKEKISFKGSIKSPDFLKKLWHKGILEKERNKFIPTGNGIILFGNSPEEFYPQAILKATVKYPGGNIEVKDFKGPLVLIPDGVRELWLKVMPNNIDRSDVERKTTTDFPYEPIREAVINALVHRDYDIAGASCHIEIDSSRSRNVYLDIYLDKNLDKMSRLKKVPGYLLCI